MSVEVRIIPNKLLPDEYELDIAEPGQTLRKWLEGEAPVCAAMSAPPFSMEVNEHFISTDKWEGVVLRSGDLVECYFEPKEPATIALVAIAVVSAAVTIHYANQSIPDNYNSTVPKGSAVYDANAQGNRSKLMGVVAQVLGTHITYPDYLNPVRRVFIDNEEYLFLMLSVGVGYYQFDEGDIFIGDTSVAGFINDIDYQVFEPGEDVSGHDAHLNVYTSKEVGGSNGLSGFELKSAISVVTGNWLAQRDYDDDNNKLSKLIFNPTWDDENRVYIGRNFVGEYYNSGRTDGRSITDRVVEITDAAPDDGFYRVVSEPLSDGELKIGVFQKLNVDYTDDLDWEGFDSSFSGSMYVIDPGDNSGLPVGPFSATPVSVLVDQIFLDFKFPNGLAVLSNEGVESAHSVEIGIEWREVGGDWVRVNHVFSDGTVDQRAYTVPINFPSKMEVEVRVVRLSIETNDLKYKEKCEWVALRSSLPSATSYSDTTTMAIRIRGSNVLASSAENKVNIIASRKVKVFDGDGDLTLFEASNDIAPIFYEVCKSAGYTDEQIDLEELYRLHLIWKARGDEFNGVFDTESTAWEAMKRILACGFAEPTLDFGQIIPVRDGPRTNIQYMYQADNMKRGSWKVDASLFDEAEVDGVELEYFSSDTWKPEVIMCTLPGELGKRTKKIRAFGITSKDKAYQFGMRKRSEIRYRRRRHTWSTEMDGLNSRYLSFDALGIDIPGYSQTGRVEVIAGESITVNQDLEWGVGQHYIALRKPDGSLAGPYMCSAGVGSDQVKVESAIDASVALDSRLEPPYFMFGVAETIYKQVLIKEINPQGTDKMQLKAVDYDERVYAYDDAVAPVV